MTTDQGGRTDSAHPEAAQSADDLVDEADDAALEDPDESRAEAPFDSAGAAEVVDNGTDDVDDTDDLVDTGTDDVDDTGTDDVDDTDVAAADSSTLDAEDLDDDGQVDELEAVDDIEDTAGLEELDLTDDGTDDIEAEQADVETASVGTVSPYRRAERLEPDGALLAQADGYRERWRTIQTGFVDDPMSAVEGADQLLAEVLRELASMFATKRGELESQWSHGGEASTDDLRVAFQAYRSFFDRVVSV